MLTLKQRQLVEETKQKYAHFSNHIATCGAKSTSPNATTTSTTTANSYFDVQQIYQGYGYNKLNYTSSVVVNIAIVIAYSYPNIQEDFDSFCSQNNLPTQTLNIVRTTPTIVPSSSWSPEICIDTQWCHAMCPSANITVVEAESGSVTDLTAAITLANTLNPDIVHMSWGVVEFSGCNTIDVFEPTIMYVASGGDNNAVQWPSTNPSVLSVSATSLYLTSTNQYSSETTWTSTGCGTSQYFPIPTYQSNNTATGSSYRNTSDLSIVGNPATGCYIYYNGEYTPYGGSSLSAPIISSTMAIIIQQRIANNLPVLNSSPTSSLGIQNILYNYYSTNGDALFNDITVGSSGGYNAGVGWDYPTGFGSPNIPVFVPYLVNYTS